MRLNNELISIIVPVYKTEAWLEKCVRSVLAQTDGGWELILVDDGSPDGSGALCDRLAGEDARIRAFHQELKCDVGLDQRHREMVFRHKRIVDIDQIEPFRANIIQQGGRVAARQRIADALAAAKESAAVKVDQRGPLFSHVGIRVGYVEVAVGVNI